ncbi:hypothetical protein GCM10010246_44360 [Streptomyces cuspidosporus]|uniref:Uncharacterized protein n=1 Tax=Streptomyces cuspidosporus TaxID=66882 RepID=A0ABN3GIR2_9ACTN
MHTRGGPGYCGSTPAKRRRADMAQQVKDVMTPAVATVRPDASVVRDPDSALADISRAAPDNWPAPGSTI